MKKLIALSLVALFSCLAVAEIITTTAIGTASVPAIVTINSQAGRQIIVYSAESVAETTHKIGIYTGSYAGGTTMNELVGTVNSDTLAGNNGLPVYVEGINEAVRFLTTTTVNALIVSYEIR